MSSLFQEFCVVTKLCMANYNVAMYVHYEAYVCAQLLFMEIMVSNHKIFVLSMLPNSLYR